ncbi:hypothetical protein [Subtercola boreus]|uniref:hypothetical protein n=1 Tax=Subtercola boreus TaxID=120213 RepID=UPI00155909BE|nr:hypothetical protein [Subtercola boreus]
MASTMTQSVPVPVPVMVVVVPVSAVVRGSTAQAGPTATIVSPSTSRSPRKTALERVSSMVISRAFRQRVFICLLRFQARLSDPGDGVDEYGWVWWGVVTASEDDGVRPPDRWSRIGRHTGKTSARM